MSAARVSRIKVTQLAISKKMQHNLQICVKFFVDYLTNE